MSAFTTAFDQHAADYDRVWTTAPAGRLQRDAVWRNLAGCFKAGDRVLDLGCGTGEDSLWLQQRNMSVTAIDASLAMVRRARARCVNATQLRIEDLVRIPGRFDGGISNFGVWNCIPSPEILCDVLASRLVRGATFALCIMSRFCFWEFLWFAAKGDLSKALRRWKGTAPASTLGINVTYHSAERLRRAMSPDFRLRRVVGIGIAVPPSYVALPGFCFRLLGFMDRILEKFPLSSHLSDHSLFIFERR